MICLLICCISAVSAAEDADGAILTQSDENVVQISESDLNELSAANEGISNEISVSNADNTYKQTVDEAVKTATASASPKQKFLSDLESGNGVVNLEGDIKVSDVIVIKDKTVINGNGHTIDGQHKTVIFENKASLTLKNLVLINGKSSGWGGAIEAKAKLTLENCVFKNNKAVRGGAIFSSSSVTIDKCTFEGNQADDYGGAICIHRGSLTLKNSKFTNNGVSTKKSTGYGGAIRLWLSTSSISNTVFKSNYVISKSLKNHKKATKYKFNGGALAFTDGGKHTITKCTFTKNKASNHGGAIFAIGSTKINIKNSNINNNRALYEDGGSISFAASKLTISNTIFKNNLAYEDGGALDSYSVSSKKVHVTLKNCKFISNTGYKGAGAIWMGVKTVYKVSNTLFKKNKASTAGAIEAESGKTQITKCKFLKNKAAKVTSWTVKTKAGGHLAHSGGAILIKNTCKVTNSVFKGNKAKYGKNVKVEGGKLISKKNKGIK